MAPEHDDYRERQLAALRRYVSDLDVRRQHEGQARPAGERRRAAWPWLLLTLLLMAVSLAAVKVAGALREHTEIMNRLLNGKLSAEAALKTGTPSLITGSAESAKFDVALADYKQVVDRCKLQAP
jgi:hypothetical protein